MKITVQYFNGNPTDSPRETVVIHLSQEASTSLERLLTALASYWGRH